MTWIGRLSAIASSSSPAVRTKQEKSRAVFRTAERAVRRSVFIIDRATPSKRLLRSASWSGPVRTGSATAASRFRRGERLDEKRAARRPRHGRALVEDERRHRRLDEQRPDEPPARR